ncbi:hypothetical protein [Acidocella sp.]|uniref:hypothetical protein n=1 Tax=Acidocella sp. TaxID=50710 RepID=UPI00261FD84D|nr:hypothetical protein [Acidocella sp.]
MQIDVQKLENAVTDLKGALKDGLLATDIWDRNTGLSLSGFNTQPAAVALFTEIVNSLGDTLESSGFPGLDRYFFMNLQTGKIVLIVMHGTDLLQGVLMDSSKVNLGVLLSVALPKALSSVQAARV